MKTGWIKLLALVCVLAVVGQARGNLLENPGFETNTGAGGSATNWTNAGRSGTEPWGGHTGTELMAVYGWTLPPHYAYFYQSCNTQVVDLPCIFSIWMCMDVNFMASNCLLELEFRDSSSNAVTPWVTNDVYSIVTTEWLNYSVTGSPPSGTAQVCVRVDVDGITAGGAVKFDDASLVIVPEPSLVVSGLLLSLIACRRSS